MKPFYLRRTFLKSCSILMILVGCLGCSWTAFGQKSYKNSLSIWNGYKYLAERNMQLSDLRGYEFIPIYPWYRGDDFGVYYERYILKHWKLGGGYGKWNTRDPQTIQTEREAYDRDSIWFRSYYRMIDLYAGYIFPIKKHSISGSIGCSYTYGTNTFIDSFVVDPLDPRYDVPVWRHERNVGYLGAMAMISYDYTFCRNRFSVGIDYKLRLYQRIYVGYFLAGMHMRVNF